MGCENSLESNDTFNLEGKHGLPTCSLLDTCLEMHYKICGKRKKCSKIFVDMLKRIYLVYDPDSPTLTAYKKFMIEIVVERDIEAQETCHMLQKFPIVVCSHPFTS